jgi:hypothetical protein
LLGKRTTDNFIIMRWSKLRKLVESRFADEVRGRVAINSAAYGRCSCGHAWVTLDGEVIANFCTRAYLNQVYGGGGTDKTKKKYRDQFVVYGEGSRQDFYQSCWDYIHKLSIDEALVETDPIIQAFAVIDRRVGKSRLAKIEPDKLHPLARRLYTERTGHQHAPHGAPEPTYARPFPDEPDDPAIQPPASHDLALDSSAMNEPDPPTPPPLADTATSDPVRRKAGKRFGVRVWLPSRGPDRPEHFQDNWYLTERDRENAYASSKKRSYPIKVERI